MPDGPLRCYNGAMSQPAGISQNLSEDNLRELNAARAALRKLRRAAWLSKGDGWTMIIFAVLTFVGGLGSWSGVIMGVFFAFTGWIELRGSAQLRRLDPDGARRLGFNQITCGCGLGVYAIWQLCDELMGHGLTSAVMAQVGGMAATNTTAVAGLVHECVVALYVSLLLIAIFGSGLLAIYYFTREKYVRAYLAETPTWIIHLQQAGVVI